MPDIFGELSRDWHAAEDRMRELTHPHLFRHDADTQAPASTPASLEPQPQKETVMSLATLESDVKNDLTDGLSYLEGMVGRLKAAAPGIIETTEAVGNSTVGKLAEKLLGAFIPPEVEPVLVGLVEDFVRRYGQPAAPAEPAASAPAQ